MMETKTLAMAQYVNIFFEASELWKRERYGLLPTTTLVTLTVVLSARAERGHSILASLHRLCEHAFRAAFAKQSAGRIGSPPADQDNT